MTAQGATIYTGERAIHTWWLLFSISYCKPLRFSWEPAKSSTPCSSPIPAAKVSVNSAKYCIAPKASWLYLPWETFPQTLQKLLGTGRLTTPECLVLKTSSNFLKRVGGRLMLFVVSPITGYGQIGEGGREPCWSYQKCLGEIATTAYACSTFS